MQADPLEDAIAPEDDGFRGAPSAATQAKRPDSRRNARPSGARPSSGEHAGCRALWEPSRSGMAAVWASHSGHLRDGADPISPTRPCLATTGRVSYVSHMFFVTKMPATTLIITRSLRSSGA